MTPAGVVSCQNEAVLAGKELGIQFPARKNCFGGKSLLFQLCFEKEVP